MEDLSAALGVSAVTIRSDLAYLEEQGFVQRSFGKALPTADYSARPTRQPSALTRIDTAPMMRTALELIEAEQNLLIGPGDLPKRILPLLVETPGLTLVLSSLDAVLVAQNCLDCTIHVLGGQIGTDGVSLDGPQALQSLQAYLIDTAIVQAKNVSDEGGLVMPSRSSEQFWQHAAERARRCIAFVASPQLSYEVELYHAPLQEVDDLVFPSVPDSGCRKVLTGSGFRPDKADVRAATHYRNNRSSKRQ